MEQNSFEKMVERGIKKIPKKFLGKLENVTIVIEKEPTPYQLEKLKTRKDTIIFGLYEGIPKTQRWHYGQVLPDKITIFQNPIQKIARSKKEVEKIVADTVWHEIAHHFGLGERQIRETETRKRVEKNQKKSQE